MLTFLLWLNSSYSTGRVTMAATNKMARVSAATGTRLTVKYLQQFLGIFDLSPASIPLVTSCRFNELDPRRKVGLLID